MPWVYDPHSGGTKIPPKLHEGICEQAESFARTRSAHYYRCSFSYLQMSSSNLLLNAALLFIQAHRYNRIGFEIEVLI
jgi:hypothetical protein